MKKGSINMKYANPLEITFTLLDAGLLKGKLTKSIQD